jgi:dihydroorotate dehydrogenase (NAD+) catalytic subunit
MLKVSLFGVEFESPVWTASGTFGFGVEYSRIVDLNKVGAVCVKGLSLKPKEGNPPPRVWETPCGMLNAIGLQNPGVDYFLERILPALEPFRCKVVVNIYGSAVEEYVELARRFRGVEGVDVLEVNASCPNVKEGGMAFGVSELAVARLTEAVKSASDKPVVVKLTPNVTDIARIARAVESAGADGVCAVNTFLGMALDIYKRKSKLGTLFGGLSGPAIKPIALRMVYQVARAVSIPVVGVGGISTWQDAVEFFLAGASAVQVGTANFYNPKAVEEITTGLKAYLEEMGYSHISQLVGNLKEC